MKIELGMPQSFSLLGKRQHQEDCLFPQQADQQSAYFVVCDGVGGRDCGDVASQLVCDTIELNLSNEQCAQLKADDIEALTEQAYDMLYDSRAISSEMATTLAFLAKTDEGMLVAHLGDSRIYQFRSREGIIFQTSDHSLVQELLNKDLITANEAESHPKKNVITKCLHVTNKPSERNHPTITLISNIRPSDIFLICTDGVYNHLGNKQLTELLASPHTSLIEKRQQLVELCQQSNDNSTAFLIEVTQVEEDAEQERNESFPPASAPDKSWIKRFVSLFM